MAAGPAAGAGRPDTGRSRTELIPTDARAYLASLERLGMKFGLDTMARLTEALGHPERSFTTVLVAGTNGKGSVTAMVHHALVAAGHRAARYTSPHLERLEERFVIGASEITTADLETAADRVREAAGHLAHRGLLTAPPTFFEAATAVAFEAFRQAAVTIAVLEVGLGGRLDATNVVNPIAAAITTVALDHQAQLGLTVQEIAREKAGVIRRGIAVVCGEMPVEATLVVVDACARSGARYRRAAELVDLDQATGGRPLALAGAHQRGNATVAACLLAELEREGIPVHADALRAGLTEVVWPGRLERVRARGRDVLLDAAHNPAGARALAAYLAESGSTGAVLVFGAMADKDVAAMLVELAPVCRAIVCTRPQGPRAMPAAEAAAHARAAGAWAVSIEEDPAAAVGAALRMDAPVVVAGSIFLIGPLRGILRA
jgi:dihydrofolate synthase / folylpolyglutamate synthase